MAPSGVRPRAGPRIDEAPRAGMAMLLGGDDGTSVNERDTDGVVRARDGERTAAAGGRT